MPRTCCITTACCDGSMTTGCLEQALGRRTEERGVKGPLFEASSDTSRQPSRLTYRQIWARSRGAPCSPSSGNFRIAVNILWFLFWQTDRTVGYVSNPHHLPAKEKITFEAFQKEPDIICRWLTTLLLLHLLSSHTIRMYLIHRVRVSLIVYHSVLTLALHLSLAQGHCTGGAVARLDLSCQPAACDTADGLYSCREVDLGLFSDSQLPHPPSPARSSTGDSDPGAAGLPTTANTVASRHAIVTSKATTMRMRLDASLAFRPASCGSL